MVWFTSKLKKDSIRPVTTDTSVVTGRIESFLNSQLVHVRIGYSCVSASKSVRSLGVMFDSKGLMATQVASVCSVASHALWRIGKIRKILDQAATEKLVDASISSRLDYCNRLLLGLPDCLIGKLQRIQNSSARLVTRTRLRDRVHITPILRELHWLPVEQRIQFKKSHSR